MKNTPIKGTRFTTFHCGNCWYAVAEIECDKQSSKSKVLSTLEALSGNSCPDCKQPLDQIEIQNHMIVLKKWPNKEPKPCKTQ